MVDVLIKTELSEIDAKIEKLKAKKKELQKKAGDRFAKLAGEAGLLDLAIGDDELLVILKEAAGRFRATAKPTPAPILAQTRPRAQAAS